MERGANMISIKEAYDKVRKAFPNKEFDECYIGDANYHFSAPDNYFSVQVVPKDGSAPYETGLLSLESDNVPDLDEIENTDRLVYVKDI